MSHAHLLVYHICYLILATETAVLSPLGCTSNSYKWRFSLVLSIVFQTDLYVRGICILLKTKTYFMYHQLQRSKILCSTHNAFMCFAWIPEQTAIFLYTKLTYQFYNRGRECLLRGTNWVF